LPVFPRFEACFAKKITSSSKKVVTRQFLFVTIVLQVEAKAAEFTFSAKSVAGTSISFLVKRSFVSCVSWMTTKPRHSREMFETEESESGSS